MPQADGHDSGDNSRQELPAIPEKQPGIIGESHAYPDALKQDGTGEQQGSCLAPDCCAIPPPTHIRSAQSIRCTDDGEKIKYQTAYDDKILHHRSPSSCRKTQAMDSAKPRSLQVKRLSI